MVELDDSGVKMVSMRIMLVACLMFTALVFGQEKRLTFEVASIKPVKPGGRGEFNMIKPKPAGQGYDAVGATVRLMINLMYKVPMKQITGGSAWLDTDLWDIQAKADHSYNLDDLHTMFQNLLADEFKLKFHKETREGPVYALMVDKGGSKMKVNDKAQDYEVPIQGGRGGVIIGKRVPMQYLCYWLERILWNDERPVIDKTGLAGNYDFTLDPGLLPDFPRENPTAGFLDLSTIFDALKQQLGLKLEAQKGPVEFYVIDHVEKPEGS
jgi:uncharacterized protein (TIGR03435 family)